MVMDVRPTRTVSSACCTSFSLSESSALVASSNSRIGGSRTRARQIATRCFWPPDSWLPRGPTEIVSEKSMRAIFLQVSYFSLSICSPASVSMP
mmetsp:Transcript_57304/g.112826  ORF Transcript_57304/g.112826 Transcript_57304/m.112826 type:complete len:94 (-) Transcript_57304:1173-1454(-)